MVIIFTVSDKCRFKPFLPLAFLSEFYKSSSLGLLAAGQLGSSAPWPLVVPRAVQVALDREIGLQAHIPCGLLVGLNSVSAQCLCAGDAALHS